MDDICRTCLRKPEWLLPLMEDSHLPYKIETISSVQVFPHDNLPKNVCAECIININVSYNFRKLIINSDLQLRSQYVSVNEANNKNVQFIDINQSGNSDDDDVDENISEDKSLIEIYKTDIEETTSIIGTADDSPAGTVEDNDATETAEDSFAAETVETNSTLEETDITEATERVACKSNRRKRGMIAAYYYRVKSKIYKCPNCEYSNTDYRKYRNHKQSHWARKTLCNICGKSIRADNLKKHISIHTEPPVACKECGKVCKNTESLRGHVLIHRGIELKCKICEKVYKYRAGYALHLKTHTQGDIKTVKCALCNKAFRGNTDLKKHMRSHTGERPYPCEFCKKGFSSSYALKTHRRQHTNERPYACALCPMAFPQKVSLRTHLKSKHQMQSIENISSQ